MKRVWILFLISLIILPLLAGAEGTPPSTNQVYEKLAAGDQGDAVVALQQRLILLSLTNSKADGIYGAKTTEAVGEAQRLLNAAGYDVPTDGTADSKTQSLLYDESAEDALLTLRLGCKGERTRQLQSRLIDLKLLGGSADGAFGTNTETAVKAFQQKMGELSVSGLTVDGVATPTVVELLNEDLSVYGFIAPIYFDASDPLSLTGEYLYAKGAIVIDAPTGETLFEHNADSLLYPASTTKIMTLLLALEHGGLESMVTIPACAADIPEDSSLVPVYEGEKLRMLDLLYGLMIRSGNDAANAVAELVAGNVDSFVGLMNQRAAELGMSNTHFMNPHGYHNESHITTARDLAMLTRQGLTDETFCQVVTCLNYTLPATRLRGDLPIANTYEIFDPSSPYYIAGAAGVKSGYTSKAGFCYVGAAQRDGRTLIAVALGTPSRNRAWLDMSKLFEYGFAAR